MRADDTAARGLQRTTRCLSFYVYTSHAYRLFLLYIIAPSMKEIQLLRQLLTASLAMVLE